MNAFDPPRRGRPPKPTQHPVGAYMRQRRETLGLTVREVAIRVGLGESSASYISQIESGAKTPNAALARRLAEVLRDDPRIYLAWAATGRRSDPVETARAVHLLGRMLGHARYAEAAADPGTKTSGSESPEAWRVSPAADAAAPSRAEKRWETKERTSPAPLQFAEPGEEHLARADVLPGGRDWYQRALSRQLPEIPMKPGPADVPQARILVPEIEEGADPGEDARSSPRVLTTHRVAADTLAGIEPPVRPFAFRVSPAGARRVSDVLAPGDLAIVSRQSWPLEPFAPYVVRRSGHLVISRVLWNARELLLLPGMDERDFIVLDAPDRTALDRLIAGKVVARIHDRH